MIADSCMWNRFFEKEGYWFYRPREHVNFGPFVSKHEAEKGASDFIAFITQAKPTVIAMLERMGQQQTAA